MAAESHISKSAAKRNREEILPLLFFRVRSILTMNFSPYDLKNEHTHILYKYTHTRKESVWKVEDTLEKEKMASLIYT